MDIEELNTKRPRLVFFLAPTKPLQSYGQNSAAAARFIFYQCYGSETGIRCLFDPLDPGWVNNQDSDPGWTTRIIFPRAWKPFFWAKILKFFDGSGMEKNRIRDPGWKKFGSGIRDKHPGSATLFFNKYFQSHRHRHRVLKYWEPTRLPFGDLPLQSYG